MSGKNLNVLCVSTFSFSKVFGKNLMSEFVGEGRGRAV